MADASKPDIARVWRNVRRIIEQGGPERDINEYLSTEGVKKSQLVAYGRAMARTDAASRFANTMTGGLADKLVAAGRAGVGEIKERVGLEAPRPFSDRYSEQVDAMDAANAAYASENPIRSGAATAAGFFMGRPANTGMSVINAARTSGAVSGGITGVGQSDGRTPLEMARDAAIGALVGFGVGDLAGRFLPRAVNAAGNVAARLRPAATPNPARVAGQEVAAAAERQKIRILPADVGGAATRRVTAAMAQTPLGAGPIVKAAEQSVGDMADAASRAATRAGAVTDNVGAGEAVTKGADAVIRRTRGRGGLLYERAGKLADGVQIRPVQAVDAIDRNIAELSATPKTNAAAIKIMSDLRDDLASGPLTVDAVRRLRTTTRDKFISEGLRGTDLERRVGQIIDAAGADIEDALVGSGRTAAAKAYRTADAYWRQRAATIDEVLAPVIGKRGEKSAEAAYAAVERMTRIEGGNAKRLAQIMKELPDDEAAGVRATIISRLGRASAGQQTAAGDAFSPATFLTNWNKMSPRAKSILFADEGLRSSLDDIARVAQGTKEAQRFANASQTGGVVGTLGTGVALPGLYFEPVLTTLGIVGNVATGKLMASPAFAKWLARGAKVAAPKGGTIADGIRDHVAQLSAVAARDATIRSEVLALQQRLTETFASGGRAAAAEEEPGNAVGVEKQNGDNRQPQ